MFANTQHPTGEFRFLSQKIFPVSDTKGFNRWANGGIGMGNRGLRNARSQRAWAGDLKMKYSYVAGAIAALALSAVATQASAAIVMLTGQFGGTGVHSTAGLSASVVTGTAGADLVTLSTVGDLLDT